MISGDFKIADMCVNYNKLSKFLTNQKPETDLTLEYFILTTAKSHTHFILEGHHDSETFF